MTDRPEHALDDAAALLVELDPDDQAGLARLAEMLEEIATRRRLPLPVQDLLGRALWLVLDASEGRVDNAEATLAEVGDLFEQASLHLPDPTLGGRPPLTTTPSAERMPDELAAGQAEPGGPVAPAAAPEAAAEGRPPFAGERAAPADRADPELLADFLAEAAEYVAGAEASLLALESNSEDVESINTVFRAFHTVKGTAGFVGLTAIAELAHSAESFFSRIRAGEIPCRGAYADLALRAVDLLKALIASVPLHGSPAAITLPAEYHELMRALEDPEAAGVATGVEASSALPRRRVTDSADGSMRVRTDRLDRLIDMVGELVIAQAMVSQDEQLGRDGQSEGLTTKVTRASKIVRELQDLSLSMRMVPLRTTFQRLARAARDLARASGKQVELDFDGEDTEIDRNMVDVVADPLLHMVRNAVDHGIESPETRQRAGKPAIGRVAIRARHEGGSVVIEMSDDGRGLDREAILRKGHDRGLIAADAAPSDVEVYGLIFRPGFSTAERVTEVSGRGVGMDVVKAAAEALRGRIDVATDPGRSTTFVLRLPLTLAITDGMLIRVGRERYVVPTINIHLTFRPARDQLTTVAGRGELVMLRGELLPMFRLHRVFEIEHATEDPTAGLLVVFDDGERRCALLIDELLGQQQVVAKSLGPYVGKVDGVSGSAILGDGRVGLILDPAEVVAMARQ